MTGCYKESCTCTYFMYINIHLVFQCVWPSSSHVLLIHRHKMFFARDLSHSFILSFFSGSKKVELIELNCRSWRTYDFMLAMVFTVLAL